MTEYPPDNGCDPLAWRARLRRERIAAREALPAAARRAANAAIARHLGEYLFALPPARIGFCLPIRAEPDCRPVIAALSGRGWRAAVPVVTQLAAPMEFRAWWPEAPLATDPYGIPVPATEVVAAPDILLLPLVAFDAAGYRLGYGGGYFDRTLAQLSPPPRTIGVGYEVAAVADIRPQAHDRPLDLVVTECGIRCFPRT